MKFNSALFRKERSDRGLTIEGMAELVGINWRTVSRLESGTHMPSAETAIAVSRALEVSLDELYVPNGHAEPQEESEGCRLP